jgi:hypothetical protein
VNSTKNTQHCRFYRIYGGVLCISIEKLSNKRPIASFYIPGLIKFKMPVKWTYGTK